MRRYLDRLIMIFGWGSLTLMFIGYHYLGDFEYFKARPYYIIGGVFYLACMVLLTLRKLIYKTKDEPRWNEEGNID